jgi:hypothetical protein
MPSVLIETKQNIAPPPLPIKHPWELFGVSIPVDNMPHRLGGRRSEPHKFIDGVEVKLCRKCEKHLPLKAFWRNSYTDDRRADRCAACCKEYQKSLRHEFRTL